MAGALACFKFPIMVPANWSRAARRQNGRGDQIRQSSAGASGWPRMFPLWSRAPKRCFLGSHARYVC